jgi:hypothetical protein
MTSLDGLKLQDIERNILMNLLLPGTDRFGMPKEPEKSFPYCKAEINEIVTFSTIGTEQIKRALMLKEFAVMMKEKEPERKWTFYNRCYLKNMNPDTMKYELSRYMCLNPTLSTKYYDKEDGLLVGLYFKNPPGRIIRNQWCYNFANNTEYRDFISSLGKSYFLNIIDGENRDFFDIGGNDDLKYFNKKTTIKCNEKTMHPSDKSVIKTVKCEIGNKIIGRSTVIKDNFIFGIRESSFSNSKEDTYHTRDEREKLNLGCEIWCEMGDPSVKLTVENVKEEKEDDSGASATFTYQDGLVIKLCPNMEIVQTRKDHQRNFKQKIVDITHDAIDDSKIEMKRVISKHGTVIRYMKNKSIQILFANGNFSVFDQKNKTWTKTKNSGERAVHKIDPESNKVIEMTDIEPLEVKQSIDPETNQNVEIRSDGVMIVNYKDGSTLVMHHDNTKIFKKTEGTEII